MDSRQVADDFGKLHKNVLVNIEEIIESLPKNGDTQQMFFKTSYIHPQNKQSYTEYLMNRFLGSSEFFVVRRTLYTSLIFIGACKINHPSAPYSLMGMRGVSTLALPSTMQSTTQIPRIALLIQTYQYPCFREF